MARVLFQPGTICGLSLLLVLVLAPRVFLRAVWFFSLHKNRHSKFQFDLNARTRLNELYELFCVTWVNKLHYIFFTPRKSRERSLDFPKGRIVGSSLDSQLREIFHETKKVVKSEPD